MKKIAIIVSIIFGIMILSGVGYYLYKDYSLEKEISNYSDYYKELAEECNLKSSPGCCIASVRRMESGNYKLLPGDGCPEGYQINTLKCIDSYKWCEPMK